LLAQARQKSSQSKAGAADPSELTVTWDWSSNARATRLLILGERADHVDLRGDEGAIGLPTEGIFAN